ncbi:LmeA family phospholipid-binding protein [Micromonospora marina]|uniref:LmeA family phospholipid-binding protein n=1 Tax=Micromonospora marina TaxID=307120 RepID=UPI003D739C61
MAAAVLVSGGMAVAVDQAAAGFAEDKLASRLACVAGLPQVPEVNIHGVPFFAQAMDGRYGAVSVLARQISLAKLTVREASATAHDVSVPGGEGQVRIGRVEAGLVMDYSSLVTQAPAGARLSGSDGLVAIETTAELFGRRVPVTVFAEALLSGATLRVVPLEVEVLGLRTSVDALPAKIPGASGVSRELPPLPGGLSYRQVTAADDGLRLSIGGEDLALETAGGNDGAKSCAGAA